MYELLTAPFLSPSAFNAHTWKVVCEFPPEASLPRKEENRPPRVPSAHSAGKKKTAPRKERSEKKAGTNKRRLRAGQSEIRAGMSPSHGRRAFSLIPVRARKTARGERPRRRFPCYVYRHTRAEKPAGARIKARGKRKPGLNLRDIAGAQDARARREYGHLCSSNFDFFHGGNPARRVVTGEKTGIFALGRVREGHARGRRFNTRSSGARRNLPN